VGLVGMGHLDTSGPVEIDTHVVMGHQDTSGPVEIRYMC